MTDLPGTVRARPNLRQLAFHYAIRQPEGWRTISEVGSDFYPDPALQTWDGSRITDWPVIYRPPTPVGTVLRHESERLGWIVAIHTDSGWVWVGRHGVINRNGATPPRRHVPVGGAPWSA